MSESTPGKDIIGRMGLTHLNKPLLARYAADGKL